MKKWLAAAVFIGSIAAFFAFGGQHWLSLESVKTHSAEFARSYAAHPLVFLAAFFAVYVTATALSFPGATILTLAAGALFGTLTGIVLVSFAATLGATLAMLLARLLLRAAVQKRFGERLKGFNEGFAREGAFYLFALRLVPAAPFFVVNLGMGLTPVRTLTYAWVSMIGMLPGSFVYVNAGTQLAQIKSTRDLVSPTLLLSFALLGVLPLVARKVLASIKARRVYKRWPRPKKFDRNLVVIGAGAAGLVSAYIAATVRAKVTLVEQHKMGGDCLNYGCVPSKALIRSARLAADSRRASEYGLPPMVASAEPDFAALMQRVQRIVAAIEPHDSVARYTELGVDVRQGTAKIVSPWVVEVDGRPITTRAIVIAAGSAPRIPEIPGLADAGFLTSDSLWSLKQNPGRMLVLGGGPIGCELAQAFARLGVEVTQVEAMPRLLLREDDEVSEFVRARLEADGVRVLCGHEALRVESADNGKTLLCKHQDGEVHLPLDTILVAVGRAPRTAGYGLEELGIPLAKTRTIATNEYLQTLYPNIYACGDVAGPHQFTHVASHQAWYAAVNALFGRFRRFRADYSVIPAVTFCDPEVARVGLNEREAQEKNIAYEVTRYELAELDRAIAEDAARGFVKVLTAPGKDRILGATIVGEHAGELLAEFTLAMRHKLGLNKLLGTIHPYPTFSEASKYAAGAWKKAHAPEKLLRWVQRYHEWQRH